MAALSTFPPYLTSLPAHYHSQATTSASFSLSYRHPFHSSRRIRYAQFSVACLASSTEKKSRPSRKLLSDDELRDLLREFVISIGLPKDHVPKTKELSHHGRKDLANIVRRRGHKLIKELLADSANIATDGCNLLENLNGIPNESNGYEKTGQEEKLNDMVEEPTDIPLLDGDSASGASFVEKHESSYIHNNKSPVSEESPMSLPNKVENFMKYGQLDAVEGEMDSDLKVNDDSEISDQSFVEGDPGIHSEVDMGHLAHVNNNNIGQNGTPLLPRMTSSVMDHKFTREFYLSAQGPHISDFKDMHIEAGGSGTEFEISCLKHMLHQKELELSLLKEEVERDKQALSILQTNVENEISKSQKLLSDKDAELNAFKESLSGLVEAKIQYSGEGQMVEVAGSFNGWHQSIKMDPQPSSAIVDPVGTRKSTLWSTAFWLYPGVYEIKFIVDGHWVIDPQRESTIKGGVENNILRVDQ